MKEHDHPVDTDHPENSSPRDNLPPEDDPAHGRSASRSSSEQEKRAPALSQRLAEAFREGIASAKPEYDKRPEVRIEPPVQTTVRKERQQSDGARTLDRVIQESGSAASVLYDKAAEVLDSAVRLAKTAPVVPTGWAQAFREGFASVRPGDARERKERIPYSGNRQQSGSRGIMDRILQVGGSAAEVVRGAVASVRPGEVGGAERKIRAAEKKVKDLYVEIGLEAVGSWNKGPVETVRLNELFSELRRNEEEIRNLNEHAAQTVAARKADAVKNRQAAKEAPFTSAGDKEGIGFDASVSDTKPEEQVENVVSGQQPEEQVENVVSGQQPESAEGGDFAVAETSASSEPEVESLRVHSPQLATSAVIPAVAQHPVRKAGIEKPDWMPDSAASCEDQVRHDAQYPAAYGGVVYSPVSTPVPEQAVDAEAVPLEEVSDEAGQALPEEPEASLEETEDADNKPPRGKQRGTKDRRTVNSSPQEARNQPGRIKKR